MARPISEKHAKTFVGLLQTFLRELSAGSNDPAAVLPLAQLRVCRVLSGGPQSISVISRELSVSPSAVTQIADRLERARLVRRLAEGGDRRVRRLQLTERCQRMMRRHDEERIRRTAAALNELTPAARKEAAAVLKMLGLAAARSKNGDGETCGSGILKSKAVKALP